MCVSNEEKHDITLAARGSRNSYILWCIARVKKVRRTCVRNEDDTFRTRRRRDRDARSMSQFAQCILYRTPACWEACMARVYYFATLLQALQARRAQY